MRLFEEDLSVELTAAAACRGLRELEERQTTTQTLPRWHYSTKRHSSQLINANTLSAVIVSICRSVWEEQRWGFVVGVWFHSDKDWAAGHVYSALIKRCFSPSCLLSAHYLHLFVFHSSFICNTFCIFLLFRALRFTSLSLFPLVKPVLTLFV